MERAQRPQNARGNPYQVSLVESPCHVQVSAGAWSLGEAQGSSAREGWPGKSLSSGGGRISGARWLAGGGQPQVGSPCASSPVSCGFYQARSGRVTPCHGCTKRLRAAHTGTECLHCHSCLKVWSGLGSGVHIYQAFTSLHLVFASDFFFKK